jgi:hypothetical protein
MTTVEIKKLIRQKFAWPGVYEIYLVTRSGDVLSCDYARKEYRQIAWDHVHKCDTGWRIEGYGLSCDLDEPLSCNDGDEWIWPSGWSEDECKAWQENGVLPY